VTSLPLYVTSFCTMSTLVPPWWSLLTCRFSCRLLALRTYQPLCSLSLFFPLLVQLSVFGAFPHPNFGLTSPFSIHGAMTPLFVYDNVWPVLRAWFPSKVLCLLGWPPPHGGFTFDPSVFDTFPMSTCRGPFFFFFFFSPILSSLRKL